MSILLFAPPKIILQTSAEDWKNSVGDDAVLFTDEGGAEKISQHVKNSFSKIEFFKNFNENDSVEKRAIELHEIHNFTNIVALAEIDVLRTARLRKKLQLPGPKPPEVKFFRDKYKMKQLAQKRGIPVANFRRMNNAIDLIEFIEDNQFPVVVKPIDGRGSAGVEILQNDEDLNRYLNSGDLAKHGPRLVEQFIEGDMYQANGLYINGKCVLISVVKCVNSCLQFLHGDFLGLCMLADDNPLKHEVINFTRHLLEHVLPMPNEGLFHVEIFHTPDDKLVLCEAACRLGGCIVNDEIRQSFLVDVRMEYLKTQCLPDYHSPLLNNPLTTGKLLGQLNIPPLQGVLKYLPDTCPHEGAVFYKTNGVVGKYYDKMQFTNGEIVSFLVKGESELQIQSRFYELADWFAKNAEWERRV